MIETLLGPAHRIRALGARTWSAVPEGTGEETTYDRRAALYDAVTGSPVYNRLVWGTSPRDYTRFAAAAVASGTGPLLDIGCGTALFTAEVYRDTERPVILSDRALAMLERAAARIGGGTAEFLHADVFDLEAAGLRPHAFATVACHGVLHLLDDPAALARQLARFAAPGAQIFATSLVADPTRAKLMLHLLHRGGEAAAPRTVAELTELLTPVLPNLTVQRTGAMAFLTARVD